VLDTELWPVIGHPGASLGAAVIAGVGVGLVDDWAQIDQFRILGDPVTPDPRNTAAYAEAYAEWRNLGDVLTPVSHRLARKARS